MQNSESDQKVTYNAVRPFIVGGDGKPFETCYEMVTNGPEYTLKKHAMTWGFEWLDCDDFLIGTFVDGKLSSLSYMLGEDRGDSKELRDCALHLGIETYETPQETP